MKLLVVSHACAAPVNQQLYAEVERLTDWEITLVTPLNWLTEYGRRADGGRWPGLRGELIQLPVWRAGDIILHAYRASLRSLLKRINPDAIYVNHEPYAVATAQVYLANRLAGRKPIGFYSCQNILKRYPLPFRWAESMVLRNSDFFFPISSTVEEVFRKKGYAGPAAILPLGVDPAVYHPTARGAVLKGQFRQGPHEVLIGYVGRLVREKGLLTLLNALASMKGLPWRLVIVGSGPLEAEFDARADALGISDRITRVGYVPHDQAPDYLSAMDVLVLPSETQPNWKEQFGRVVIEAMACGAAVLGSDSGEIPNLIRDTGGGLIFHEGDSTDLARQLTLLLADPALRSRVARQGCESVRNRYAIGSIAKALVKTISDAVGKSSGASVAATADVH